MKVTLSSIALAAIASAWAANASAALLITEVMSSSGTGGTADWFELTNTRPAAVNLTGYKMDDNSNSFAAAVPMSGVATISVGESAVFVESANPAVDLPAFRAFWSGLAGVQVGSYTGSLVGLSSSGDGVSVFDAGGATVAGPVSFGAATTGVSFGYNPNTATFGGLSVAGQFGAFVSANALANVGSPGTTGVPEPATLALTLCGIVAIAQRRNRQAV